MPGLRRTTEDETAVIMATWWTIISDAGYRNTVRPSHLASLLPSRCTPQRRWRWKRARDAAAAHRQGPVERQIEVRWPRRGRTAPRASAAVHAEQGRRSAHRGVHSLRDSRWLARALSIPAWLLRALLGAKLVAVLAHHLELVLRVDPSVKLLLGGSGLLGASINGGDRPLYHGHALARHRVFAFASPDDLDVRRAHGRADREAHRHRRHELDLRVAQRERRPSASRRWPSLGSGSVDLGHAERYTVQRQLLEHRPQFRVRTPSTAARPHGPHAGRLIRKRRSESRASITRV